MNKKIIFSFCFLFACCVSVHADSIVPLLGGDLGDGLDLSGGNVVYAVDFHGPGATIQGVAFTPDATTAGVSLTSSGLLRDFNGTINLGTSADDNAIESIIGPLNWAQYADSLLVDLDVSPGQAYELSLILSSANADDRIVDILLENAVVADDLSLLTGEATLLSHHFVAGDSTARLSLIHI